MKYFNLYYSIEDLGVIDRLVIKDVEFKQAGKHQSEAILRNVLARNQQEAEIKGEYKINKIINLISYKYEYPVSFYLSKVEDNNGKMLAIYGRIISKQRMSLSNQATPEIEKLLELYKDDEIINNIFSLLNRNNPYSWVNMYRIYEIINNEISKDTKRKLMSNNQEARFRLTANHPEHTGCDSRHGVLNSQPHPKPMSLCEASEFIKELIQNFIKLRSK